MPRLPKRGSDRRSHHARQNTKTFPANGGKKVPAMPNGIKWTPSTREWWASIWTAPWAAEYSQPDRIALGRLAELVQAFEGPDLTARDKAALHVEIRLAGQAFGLDAASRRRLGWDVERPKPPLAAQKNGERTGAIDPRDILDEA